MFKAGFYLLVVLVVLESCAARVLGFLAAEEIGLIRAAGVRVGLAGMAIENEVLLASRLARVRMFYPAIGVPRLFIVENGARKYFAELTSVRTIKWLKSGTTTTLPGRLYAVRRGLISVNLRSGPGLNFPVFKKLEANQLVVVLGESVDWFKVQLSNKLIGWVSAVLLADALIDNIPVPSKQPGSSNIKKKLNEVRFVPIIANDSAINFIKNEIGNIATVSKFSTDPNPVPQAAINRIQSNITIRYFSLGDKKIAEDIKSLILSNAGLSSYSVAVESMLPYFKNPIKDYVEIWFK